MKAGFISAGLALWLMIPGASRAEPPLAPVTARDFYPLSRLQEAQSLALAQGKPVGFLLTWPAFFPGAPGFLKSGSDSTTYFHHAFKDQAVLVAVDHSTGELDRLPKVAHDAFSSPAEGGYAPCLCLTDPTFTKLIGMLPLWRTSTERQRMFAQYQAIIADKSHWGDAAGAETAAAEPLPSVPSVLPPVPVAPALTVASPGAPARGRQLAPLPPSPPSPPVPSTDFQREMALTLAAERREQQQKTTPSPSPRVPVDIP